MQHVNIDWKPNKDSKIPLYRQIVEYITGKISSGDWSIGQKLPPQREMAKQFGVNRSTIVTAMDELLSYDLIESDFGKGTFIKSNTWSLLMSSPPDWEGYVDSGSFEENWDTVIVLNNLCSNPDYLDLGVGELSPNFFPKELHNDIAKTLNSKDQSLNYLAPLGLDELRLEISKLLHKKGIDAGPGNILITSGSLQALHLISVGMLRRGDSIYAEAPGFLHSLQVFESNGVELDPVPMDSEGMSTRSIKSKHRSVKTTPKLLYTIPNFQSPTSITMSEERRKDLFKFCQNERLPIVEDDAFGELYYDSPPPASLKSMDAGGMVLYLGTFSTILAPGLRVGWLVGPESVITRLADIKMQIDYGASSLSQTIAHTFLKNYDYQLYMDRIRNGLRKRKDHIIRELKKHLSGYATWTEPKGGLHIWITLNKKPDMYKIFYEAVHNKLIIVPGYIYERSMNYSIRLTYSYSDMKDISLGVKKLAEIIKRHYYHD